VRVVPLTSAPNQAFTVTLDGVRWALSLKEARGVMCASVSRDGVRLLDGVRALAGQPLIPYRYLETGNFVFLTTDDNAPDWALFGVTQTLVYLSAAEISEIPPVTAGQAIAAGARVGYIFTDDGFYVTTDTGDLIEDA
jgi:hypothetical protein